LGEIGERPTLNRGGAFQGSKICRLTAKRQSCLKVYPESERIFFTARQYKCISGDGHIDLNPDIWRDRVQVKFRERAPKRR
jgi:hypothetical protein